MKASGKIFVPYSEYYSYLADDVWGVSHKSKICYSASPGLMYQGIDSSFAEANADNLVAYRVGNGTNTPGNGYSSAFEGSLLGIPRYYNEDDTYQIKSIGPHAFNGCTQIERVTIGKFVQSIGTYAFYGCSKMKFVIMESETPPSIFDTTFANNAGDRIFVVPTNAAREAYITATVWSLYAALIITWDEYLMMSEGGGFTHFVFKLDTEKTFAFNITKYNTSAMTVIYGDGESEVVTVNGSITKSHIYAANDPGKTYTMSIIARGPWTFSAGARLTGSATCNTCIREVYFDNNYAAMQSDGITGNYEHTFEDTNLLENAVNLETLRLTNNAYNIPFGFLRGLRSLVNITIPFVGKSINPYGEGIVSNGFFGYIFGSNSYAGGTEVHQYTNPGEVLTGNNATYYIPATLRSVTILNISSYIPNGAFYGCSMLTRVVLPEISSYSINAYAFYGCTNVNIPNLTTHISSIGDHCFDGCESLNVTEIPSTITTIPDYAFNGCTLLALTALPSGVTTIGDYAFKDCEAITLSALPSGVTSIGEHCFDGCTSITFSALPSGVTTIPAYAFNNCENITLSEIPSSMTSIPDYAFNNCPKVTFSTLPNGLTSIGDYAFCGDELVTFSTFPTGVVSIGDYAFSDCSEINFSAFPTGLTTIGAGAFQNDTNVTFQTLPNSITAINANTFKNCTNISFSDIPTIVSVIGAHAFDGCSNLRIVSLPNNASIGAFAFCNCGLIRISTLPSSIQSIPEYAFYGCNNITISYIPSSITNIGELAFSGCTGIINLSIGDISNSIGSPVDNPLVIASSAFASCTSLLTISIYTNLGGSYPSLRDEAFNSGIATKWGATNATVSFRTASQPTEGVELDPYFTFEWYDDGTENGSYSLTGIKAVIGTADAKFPQTMPIGTMYNDINSAAEGASHGSLPITKIGDGAFELTATNTAQFSAGTSISFSDASAISSIGSSAFKNNVKISYIRLPRTVITIGDNAFDGCTNLNISDLPSDLVNIGNYAFKNCSSSTISTLPSNIESIGIGAFDGCTNITTLYMDSCVNLVNCDLSSTTLTITEATIPVNGYRLKTIKTKNDDYTLVCKFRVSVLGDYTILDASTTANAFATNDLRTSGRQLDAGFKIYTYSNKLFAGSCLLYSDLQINRDYTVIIRGTTSDENVMNSLIFGIHKDAEVLNGVTTRVAQTIEYNRYNFGYVHPVTSDSSGNNITTYGLYGFAIPQNSNVNITKLEYYASALTEDQITTNFEITLFTLPSWANLQNTTAIRGVHPTDSALADIDQYSLSDRSKYHLGTQENNGNDKDRFSNISWYNLAALGREGYIKLPQYTTASASDAGALKVVSNATTPGENEIRICTTGLSVEAGTYVKPSTTGNNTAYKAKWCIYRNGTEEEWLQCGECKQANLVYPEGSAYKDCNGNIGTGEETGPMWFEILGFNSDLSTELGECPITIGMKDLLPDKSQLYSTSHYMRDTILSTNESGVGGTANGTAITATETGRVWITANDTSTITSITVKTGSTTNMIYYFSSSVSTNNYMMCPFNTKYHGVRAYLGPVYQICTSSDAGALLVIANSETATAGQIRVIDAGMKCVAGDYVKPYTPTNDECLLIDARLGIFSRDTASECCVITKGCKIGIPVTAGQTVNVVYYSSWNLTGWRDCIARTAGNLAHYNALPVDLRDITETVVKYTNIGGLHTTINETTDKLWLYSLSEAGMYNATDPYMYEGTAFQWYQPSVASNGGRTTVRRKFAIGDTTKTYDYWWLRTPDVAHDVWGQKILDNGSGTIYYHSVAGSLRVCFGLSIRGQKGRRTSIAEQVQSATSSLQQSAAAACNPKQPMTHIYQWIVKDKTVGGEPVFDVRFSVDGANELLGGYVISTSSAGLYVQGVNVYAASNYSNGDKLGLVIRKPKKSDSEASTDSNIQLMVFKNDVHVATANIQTLSYDASTTTGLGVKSRMYSTDTRKVTIGNSNSIIDTIEFYNKELTDAEIGKLHTMRYQTI